MDVFVFLFWVYCGLSWVVMIIKAFAPTERKTTGKVTVAVLEYNKDTDSLTFHIVIWSLALALAPLFWLIYGSMRIVSAMKTAKREALYPYGRGH